MTKFCDKLFVSGSCSHATKGRETGLLPSNTANTMLHDWILCASFRKYHINAWSGQVDQVWPIQCLLFLVSLLFSRWLVIGMESDCTGTPRCPYMDNIMLEHLTRKKHGNPGISVGVKKIHSPSVWNLRKSWEMLAQVTRKYSRWRSWGTVSKLMSPWGSWVRVKDKSVYHS